MSFSHVSPLDGLQLQSRVGPFHGGHKSCQDPAQAQGLLSTEPQVLPGSCSRPGFPRGYRLHQTSTCSRGGLPQALGGSLLLCVFLWAAGAQLLLHGLPHGLQGKLRSGSWSPPAPPLSLTLVSLQTCFSHIFSLLSVFSFALTQQVFPLLKYVIPEVLPLLLMSLALASGLSILELLGIGRVGHGGSFCHLLTEATYRPFPTTITL